MESKLTDQLKELSKNEQSFKKLKELFEEIYNKKEKKQQHLELLEHAIQNDYDSILITELDLEEPGPKIVYVNDGFCKMTGYSKGEVLGKTPRILQGPKTDEAVLKKLKQRLTEGYSFFGRAINYRKDGSEFVNQWDIHPLSDLAGTITHWVSYQHDITERKRAEKMLIDTRVDFDNLREESQRTILDVDLQGSIVMANKSFRDLIGYDKEELKTLKAWDLFPKKYRHSLQSRFGQGTEIENFTDKQFRGIVKHRGGFPIQVEGKTQILKLKDETLIRADIKNISLQKRVMDALQRRNKDYSKIFEKAAEFTYRLQLNNGELAVEYVSEEFPELTGLSPDTVCCKGGLKKLIHDEDLKEAEDHFQEVMKGKSCTCEYRIRSKKNRYVKIIDYGKPEWDEHNTNVVAVRGAISLKSPISSLA